MVSLSAIVQLLQGLDLECGHKEKWDEGDSKARQTHWQVESPYMVYPQFESLFRDPPTNRTNRTKPWVNTMNGCIKTAFISVIGKLLTSLIYNI